MWTIGRRRFNGALALATLCAAGGCLSPTLPPLPPPAQPELSYVAEGQLLLQGRVSEPRASVLVFNVDTDEIAGQAVQDGSYAFTIGASPGDRLQLWYEVGRERSDYVQFLAPTMTLAGEEPAGIDAGSADASTPVEPRHTFDASDDAAADLHEGETELESP